MTADWQRLARPGFSLELSYPSVTPQGHEVADRGKGAGPPRRHGAHPPHVTRKSGALRRVARFRDLAPRDEYLHHRRYLEQRFGADSVTALAETTVASRPAWAYAFRWDEGERSVLLLELARDTYRVIYDPRSGLNAQVIATLTIEE